MEEDDPEEPILVDINGHEYLVVDEFFNHRTFRQCYACLRRHSNDDVIYLLVFDDEEGEWIAFRQISKPYNGPLN